MILPFTEVALAAYLGGTLGAAGLAKIVDPVPAIVHLERRRPSLRRSTVRTVVFSVAVGEVVLALAAVATGIVVVHVALFVTFAAIAAAAANDLRLRRETVQVGCGCFGRHSLPTGGAKAAVALIWATLAASDLSVVAASDPSATADRLKLLIAGIYGSIAATIAIRMALRSRDPMDGPPRLRQTIRVDAGTAATGPGPTSWS